MVLWPLLTEYVQVDYILATHAIWAAGGIVRFVIDFLLLARWALIISP